MEACILLCAELSGAVARRYQVLTEMKQALDDVESSKGVPGTLGKCSVSGPLHVISKFVDFDAPLFFSVFLMLHRFAA